jgi:hypothetical protein
MCVGGWVDGWMGGTLSKQASKQAKQSVTLYHILCSLEIHGREGVYHNPGPHLFC